MTMSISSSAFGDHEAIPSRCAHDREDLSPPLMWSGQPAGTRELALSCIDPDAPGGTWVHWLVAGIDPSAIGCDEGKPPQGAVEGTNSFHLLGYGGPLPPIGDQPHRYFFRVHALNAPLDLAEGFQYEDLQRGLAEYEIASAAVVGTYSR